LRNIVVSLVESDGVPKVGEKKRDLDQPTGSRRSAAQARGGVMGQERDR
jgi:hypothetical protein